ncbi:MAG: hypothetical protein PHU34_07830 [Candidatus Methanoperedens sp.]|nr:hypothetical protein [Candidatus Methanoperedens sp.]
MEYIWMLMIVAIILLAIAVKYRNRNIKAEWILVAALIGISSIPIGIYIGRDIIFSILILAIFTTCYIYLRKLPAKSFLKVFAVSFLIALIAFVGSLMAYYDSGHYDTVLEIKRFDIQGYEYVVNITTDELNQYPVLQKAINSEGCTKSNENNWHCGVIPEEWNKIKDFINTKEIHDRTGRGTCFKFGEKFGEKCFTFGFITP